MRSKIRKERELVVGTCLNPSVIDTYRKKFSRNNGKDYLVSHVNLPVTLPLRGFRVQLIVVPGAQGL